ncbi:hypothetical protein Naga_100297g3 [Nannochloropsis gaditana]|uniref:Uncharacterized protein n=1 Tax=Nannochloropsis gaditana TaxID=72520 RepID=W7TGW0_9STRA|nr:hypothetical protein Naga_100297g3 [Nannochloropsis gaditana]
MSSASANYFSTAIFGQSQEKRTLVLPVTSPVGDLSSSSCPPTTQGSGSKNANGLPSKSVNSTPDGGNSDFKNKYTPFPPTTHSISPSSPSPRFRDWLRPSKMTSSVSALLDVWIPWLTYLGIGIGSENFVVGGLVAAGVAIAGFIFQAFRFYYQRTLRTWPKPQAVGILMTWVGNAVYVSRIASNKETASRYTLLVVITGVVLSNFIAIVMGHPALLDEAKEHVASEEEEKHPLFLRMHTIASYGLLFLSLLQWPCFFLAAFRFPNDKALTPILLLALPLGSLIITLVIITLYLRREEKRLSQAMRAPLLAVDVEQGG